MTQQLNKENERLKAKLQMFSKIQQSKEAIEEYQILGSNYSNNVSYQRQKVKFKKSYPLNGSNPPAPVLQTQSSRPLKNGESYVEEDEGQLQSISQKRDSLKPIDNEYKLPHIRSIENLSIEEKNLGPREKEGLKQMKFQKLFSNNNLKQPNLKELKDIVPQQRSSTNESTKFVKVGPGRWQNYSFTDNSYKEQPKCVLQKNQKADKGQNYQSSSNAHCNQLMTEQEKQCYGSRCAKGYKRVTLLGRGGCALVWLCQNTQDNINYAVKQFPKSTQFNNSLSSGYKELSLNRKLFLPNGNPYPTYEGHEGIAHICKMAESRDEKSDLYLMFEVCGKPMSKQFFEVKGEFYKGERIYQVLHKKEVYRVFERNGCEVFRKFIY